MKYMVVRVCKTTDGKFGALELMALHPTRDIAMETVLKYKQEWEEFKVSPDARFMEKITGFPSTEYLYVIVEVNDYTIY